MNLSTGPHPLALKRAYLGKLGAKPIRKLFALATEASPRRSCHHLTPAFRRAVTDALGSSDKLPPTSSRDATPHTSAGTPLTDGEGVVYLLKARPF